MKNDTRNGSGIKMGNKNDSLFHNLCPLCSKNNSNHCLIIYSFSPNSTMFYCPNCYSVWEQGGVTSNDQKLYMYFFTDKKTQNKTKSIKALEEVSVKMAELFDFLAEKVKKSDDIHNPVYHWMLVISIFLQKSIGIAEAYIGHLKRKVK